MISRIGWLVAAGAIVMTLSVGAAQAQFDPFGLFKQQQPPPPPPQSQPAPPQRAQPATPKAQPAQRAAQPAAPAQKSAAPAQKAAPAPTVSAPYGEVRTACQSEIKGTCAGVVPGSADSVQCLRRNFAVHSPACQAALTRAGSVAAQPAAAPAQPSGPAGTSETPRVVSTDRKGGAAAATSTEPLKPLATPSMRPTQEARFVNRYCREDHSLLCQGVTFGQGRVLKCLASHQKSLTGDCVTAMTKLR